MVWPLRIIFLATIAILIGWTVASGYGWVREEIDSISGESIGKCSGENNWAWFVPLLVLAAIPTALTMLMAWKTKDVDEAFSESWWIFALVFTQLQVRFDIKLFW